MLNTRLKGTVLLSCCCWPTTSAVHCTHLQYKGLEVEMDSVDGTISCMDDDYFIKTCLA